VGSGYTSILESPCENGGRTLGIEFGAGSFPTSAHGLNRLGYIQEAVVEETRDAVSECAYFAFMTASPEKNAGEARAALEHMGETVPYTATRGYGKDGSFLSRVDRLAFPAQLTWRDIAKLTADARTGSASREDAFREVSGTSPTFLYAVLRAQMNPAHRTSEAFCFNGRQFTLETKKEDAPNMAAQFEAKNLLARGRGVTQMNATIAEAATSSRTPFRLWFERGAESAPPLRFEYQAKSFLRLAFEAEAPVLKESE
jgi:hypothetical protein